jgi:ATP-binding cassette subfamily C protein
LAEADWRLEAIASEASELDVLPLSTATLALGQAWFTRLSAVLPTVASDYALDQISRFSSDLSQGLDQRVREDLTLRTERLTQRAQFNAAVTHEAFQALASVLKPEPMPDVSRGSELMGAMGAIAHRLKIPIQPIRAADLGAIDPVMAIAQASHFRVRRVSLVPGWWKTDSGPLLGYLTDQTPVALLPRPGGYDFYHARTQRRARLSPRMARSIESHAYSFYRPLPVGNNKAALFQFALADQWGTLTLTFLLSIAVTLLGMLIPQATGMLIDYAIPNADQRTLLHLGVGLAVVAIASTIFRLLQNLATMRLEAKGDAATQAALWDHLLKLKLDFFRQFSTGDLQSRVSAIRQIRQLLSGTTLHTLISGLVAGLNLVLLFLYSQTLAWVALGVTLFVVMATVVASLLIRGNIRRQQELSGELFGFIVQLINGIAKLRVAHGENRAFASWANRFTQLVRLSVFEQRVEDGIALLNTVIPSLANAVIFGLVVDLIQPDPVTGVAPRFSTGTYLAFNAAFGLLLSGATSLSNTLVNVLDVWILWGRVRPILEAEPEITPHMSDPGLLTGAIQVQNCTFRYRVDGPPVLNQVDLSIRPGDFVALVGPSGSGKSTLLRLLLGFEVPESGRILYDGQDLLGLDVTAVRRQLGVVLQQSKINAASLYENIAGNANITQEAAFRAANLAGMAADLAAMPMGLHTLVSEGGGNLSGGQRQRLIIARALAKDPRVLLWDEATSALDNRTQDIVMRSLERLNMTRVIIAHRLSTVRMADRILVLDQGKIIQSGTFEMLASQPGLFQTLMSRQAL